MRANTLTPAGRGSQGPGPMIVPGRFYKLAGLTGFREAE
jgi:hypothetical protein